MKQLLALGCIVLLAALPWEPAALAQATGTVTGSVRDATNGQPIGGAQVSIPSLNIGALANNVGRYLLLNVPAGTHTVTASMTAHAAIRSTPMRASPSARSLARSHAGRRRRTPDDLRCENEALQDVLGDVGDGLRVQDRVPCRHLGADPAPGDGLEEMRTVEGAA